MRRQTRIRVILFDLDETLYPRSSGIMSQLKAKILQYMIVRLQIDPGEAEELRVRYLRTYGTSMRGLQIHHAIDPDDFLEYVHDLPVEQLIEPAPELSAVLGRLPVDKVIFTNASREHAERVLRRLGVQNHFRRIVDVRDVCYRSKPDPDAYVHACNLLGVRPEECVIVEDSVRNLMPAKELGMVTILVDGVAGASVDYVVPAVVDIEAILLGNLAAAEPNEMDLRG